MTGWGCRRSAALAAILILGASIVVLVRARDGTASDGYEVASAASSTGGEPAIPATRSEEGAAEVNPLQPTRTAVSQADLHDAEVQADLLVSVQDPSSARLPHVPVDLVLRDRLRPELVSNLSTANTSAQGVAVFSGFGERLAQLLSDPEVGQFELRVRCGLPFDEPPEAAVLMENVCGQAVVLRLPGIGWVDASVDEPLDGATVEVSSITWRRIDGGGNLRSSEIPGVSAQIGPLGLGWRLRIEARSTVRADPVALLEIDGPTRFGEIVQAFLEPTASLRIHGTVVDADGLPFASVPMIARIGLGSRVFDMYAKSDVSGRFVVAVAAGVPLEFLELKRSDVSGPVPAGRVEGIRAPAGATELDVGQVVLRVSANAPRNSLIASGTTVDERGERLADVRVTVLMRPDDPGSSIASMRSGADGSFRLEAGVPPDVSEAYLVTFKSGYVPVPPLRTVIGREGIQLSLIRGGSVSGTVLVDSWVPRDLISLKLYGGQSVDKQVLADWGTEYVFEGEDDHEGRLEVGIRESSWVLEKRADFVLRAGTPVSLPPIDLRDRLRSFHLSVRDPEGHPVPDRWLRLRDAFGQGFESLRSSPDGEIVNLAPAEVEVLYLNLAGFEEATVPLSQTPIEVTLHPRDG